MSTSATDFAAINAELDAELARQGQGDPTQPPPLPQAPPDLSAEITALKSTLQAQQAQLEAYRTAQQTRYVGPEGEEPVQRHTQAPPSTIPVTRTLSTEDWAEIAKKNPGEATVEAINAYLNLPKGTNPFKLFDFLGNKIAEVENKLTASERRSQETAAALEAREFMNSTPDYTPTKENGEVLTQYLTQYGLEPKSANWQLVYTKAVADGAIKPTRRQEEPVDDGMGLPGGFPPQLQAQAQAPARSRAIVPSLRQGTTAQEPDIEQLISKLDRMPSAQAKQWLDKLSGNI